MRLVLATHNKGKLREFREILRQQLGKDLGGLELVSAGDLGLADPVETGTTFVQNSLLKARFVSQQTGLPAVSDDSGLIVDVLGRAPGILSARWAGHHGDDKANLELLLAQMHDIPDAARTARFECAATLIVPSGVGANRSDSPIVVTEKGEMRGLLARKPRGKNGFGYDPIFLPDDQPTATAGSAAPALASASGDSVEGVEDDGEGSAIPAAAAPTLSAAEAQAALETRLSAAQLTAEQKDAISHRGKAMRKIARDISVYLRN